jgi:transposase
MHHIGIDLGGMESQLCVREGDGTILDERRVPTAMLPEYLRHLPAKSRVVMETCAEAFHIADAAMAAEHETRVVPATLVRSLGIGARGIKTDVRDARVQSEASCRMNLPSVHIPSHASRELKSMLNMRDALISARTQLCNTVRGYLRGKVMRVRCTPVTMAKRVRAAMAQSPMGLPGCIERQLLVIESLNAQIAAADKELEAAVMEQPTCRLLMTAPAVGPVTAARFVTSIDEVTRFPNAHARRRCG